MRSAKSIRIELDVRRIAIARLKNGQGFQPGHGKYTQAEARRRKKEIRDLEMLAEYDDEEESE